MAQSGKPRPQARFAAHHIASSTEGRYPEAILIRNILKSFRIDINAAENGVWLDPSLHGPIHTATYNKNLLAVLLQATTQEEVIGALQSVRQKLATGTFPY